MSHTDGDWNAEWTRLSDLRDAAHDAAFWDRRAKDFHGGDESSPYVAGFLARAQLAPGESVLDVGAGSGTLALPLRAPATRSARSTSRRACWRCSASAPPRRASRTCARYWRAGTTTGRPPASRRPTSP